MVVFPAPIGPTRKMDLQEDILATNNPHQTHHNGWHQLMQKMHSKTKKPSAILLTEGLDHYRIMQETSLGTNGFLDQSWRNKHQQLCFIIRFNGVAEQGTNQGQVTKERRLINRFHLF